MIESECARRAGRADAGVGVGASAAGGAEAAAAAGAAGAAGEATGAAGVACVACVTAGAAGAAGVAAAFAFEDFDFEEAGGVAAALAADAEAFDPRAGVAAGGAAGAAGVGAGGGDNTIVGLRSAAGGEFRGVFGKAPPRADERESDDAADGGGSLDEPDEPAGPAEPAADEDEDSLARSPPPPPRRGSRCGPCHSQIERPDSVDEGEPAGPAAVANAGLRPGAGEVSAEVFDAAGSLVAGVAGVAGVDGVDGVACVAGAAGAGGGAVPCERVVSGSSFIALPLSSPPPSPAEASVGAPS